MLEELQDLSKFANENNIAVLCGKVTADPVLDHMSQFEEFVTAPLYVPQYADRGNTIPLIISTRLIDEEISEGDEICVLGQLRSKQTKNTGLRTYLYVKSIMPQAETGNNEIFLDGTIESKRNPYTTPKGLLLQSYRLAVTRSKGRVDLIPCTSVGRNAGRIRKAPLGERVQVRGFIRSESYIGKSSHGKEKRTVIEVSADHTQIVYSAERQIV